MGRSVTKNYTGMVQLGTFVNKKWPYLNKEAVDKARNLLQYC